MENRNVLLSAKDLEVEFRVRGRTLTAIRGISLDIYENESLAIVGESAAGKSVFTKTFAGMLEENGHISNGSLIFNDEELSDTWVSYGPQERRRVDSIRKKLDAGCGLEAGAATYREICELKAENRRRSSLSVEEEILFDEKIKDLNSKYTEAYNLRLTVDPRGERERYKQAKAEQDRFKKELDDCVRQKNEMIRHHRAVAKKDTVYAEQYKKQLAALTSRYRGEVSGAKLSEKAGKRNGLIAKEIYLSVGRYSAAKRASALNGLEKAFRTAMRDGVDLYDDAEVTRVFDEVAFRVKFLEETGDRLHGNCIINLAKIRYAKDWCQIRGTRIATIFQDPMTSLNPILTIGKQISSIIMKHQKCSEVEARARAITLMKKVGIPNAENRYDDYPFQYSGGMRQRIVIAIALSCQPKILICDEPTTALDVTIQAQILKLIKDLQKEFHYTIVFITHDLGVVANIADRVAVIYAGQIVEVGMVDEIFFDPKHPYTWALLSSMPQLAERGKRLFSISGTPPSLYNKITGDPFAPRNPYCLKIDTLKAPPMFKVSETHYAKTWLLDPRAPKVEKPEAIRDIHQKMIKVYRIGE